MENGSITDMCNSDYRVFSVDLSQKVENPR
jgi:hypothetical protein